MLGINNAFSRGIRVGPEDDFTHIVARQDRRIFDLLYSRPCRPVTFDSLNPKPCSMIPFGEIVSIIEHHIQNRAA